MSDELDYEYNEADYGDVKELKSRKVTSVLTAITLIIASALFLKTTLAANVTLSPSQNVEFGQGISVYTACAGSNPLTLTPKSGFANAAGGSGTFSLSAFTLSNIPTTCYGKAIDISAYANSGSNPLALFNTTVDHVVVYDSNGTFWVVNAGSGYTVTTNSNTSFTVTFTNPVSTSGTLTKFALQSMENTATLNCQQAGNCSVGSTNGPGGGIVFYYTATPFTETGAQCNTNCHYLEMAPDGWNGTANDPVIAFTQNTSTYLGTTGGGIGAGLANTVAFANLAGTGNSSNSASVLALTYAGTDGSAGQWFVPSQGELNELIDAYINHGIGGLRNNSWYSSSTEISATLYWTQLSQYPGKPTTQTGRADGRATRLVRAF